MDVRADSRSLRALGAVSALAHRPGALGRRAEAALEAIAAFAPSDGAVLDAWNPALGRHEVVAAANVPATALAYDASSLIVRDPGYLYVRARRVPHRRCDVPGAARNPLITDVCDPVGYREGVTACLFSDGRYTGMLNLGIVEDHPLEPWRMTLLAFALDALGRLVDVARSAESTAAALPPAAPAAVVRADGTVEPVEGRPPSPLLDAGSPLLRAARRQAPRGLGSSAFVWHDGERLWRVLVLRLGDAGAAGALLVTVAEARTALTLRELEVLTLITDGRANPAIGASLGISTHTVARHVEHILDKLGVGSRVEAATCAVREGLVLVAP